MKYMRVTTSHRRQSKSFYPIELQRLLDPNDPTKRLPFPDAPVVLADTEVDPEPEPLSFEESAASMNFPPVPEDPSTDPTGISLHIFIQSQSLRLAAFFEASGML
jgi:hypothetical protein